MRAVIGLVYVLAVACLPPKGPDPTPPPPPPQIRDGGPLEDAESGIANRCALMCGNLAILACGREVGGGIHCQATCVTVLVNGMYPIPVDCYTRARTCAQARVCKGGS